MFAKPDCGELGMNLGYYCLDCGKFYLFKSYSNTPRLYSHRLNSVIYWLINNCMDWARTDVTSFGRQLDFHDVIYPIQHCNDDNRRRNIVLQLLNVYNVR